MNEPRAAYVVNATSRADGRTYRITVEVDLNAIAREYGERARKSKGGRARLANGMVKIRAEYLQSVFARNSALPGDTLAE